VLTAPTFAAALVSGLRAHGHRPSGPDGRRWSAVADEARTLALGLAAVGAGTGRTIRVALGPTAAPATLLAAEVAVLAAGAALAVDDDAGADLRLGADGLTPDGPDGGDRLDGDGAGRSLADLRAAGLVAARNEPALHEDRLAALDPASIALRSAGHAVTHAQAVWALRCVAAWVGPAVPDGPRAVLAPPPGAATAPVPAALVGRWWPAAAGAQLALVTADRSAGPGAAGGATSVAGGGRTDPVGWAREVRPDVVVGDGATWAALADAVRAGAGRTRAGEALLRRGRALVAGEATGRTERAGRNLAERRAGVRVRGAAGLDALAVGVCLGPLDLATGRDLAAAGLPVVATWIDPAVPAPVASGPRARPTPGEPWGRPLPGRSLVVGPPLVVHGGDVAPEGVTVEATTEVDTRDRVRLPRTTPEPVTRSGGNPPDPITGSAKDGATGGAA
jgi:hypothetical protein